MVKLNILIILSFLVMNCMEGNNSITSAPEKPALKITQFHSSPDRKLFYSGCEKTISWNSNDKIEKVTIIFNNSDTTVTLSTIVNLGYFIWKVPDWVFKFSEKYESKERFQFNLLIKDLHGENTDSIRIKTLTPKKFLLQNWAKTEMEIKNLEYFTSYFSPNGVMGLVTQCNNSIEFNPDSKVRSTSYCHHLGPIFVLDDTTSSDTISIIKSADEFLDSITENVNLLSEEPIENKLISLVEHDGDTLIQVGPRNAPYNKKYFKYIENLGVSYERNYDPNQYGSNQTTVILESFNDKDVFIFNSILDPISSFIIEKIEFSP